MKKSATMYAAPGGMVTEDPRSWADRRRSGDLPGKACLLAVYARFGLPISMLDLGCGLGNLVRLSALLGIESVGVEVMFARNEKFKSGALIRGDLTKPITLPKASFDLVISWEVAEHLPRAAADQFVATLCQYSSHRLVFSAAPPGQKGTGHVNCQPQEYWRDKLEAGGMMYMPGDTDDLKSLWWHTCARRSWYPLNVQVFTRRLS